GLPAQSSSGPPFSLDSSLFSVQTHPPGIVATLKSDLPGGLGLTITLTDVWFVQILTTGTLTGGVQATVVPPANVTLQVSAGLKAQFESDLIAKGADATHPLILIGQTGGSRLQTDSFTFGMGLTVTADSGGKAVAEPFVRMEVKGGKVV